VPRAGEAVRYLVLERSVAGADGQPSTVLGEWLSGGDHVNLGAGPPPDPARFLAAVHAYLHEV
jgi:hypothetical protein